MKHIFYTQPTTESPSNESNHLAMPEVRGWPTYEEASYNASSPGSTFNRWNSNAGLTASGGGVFKVSREFVIAGPATGKLGTLFWIPRPDTPYAIVSIFLIIESIIFDNEPTPANNVIVAIGPATSSNSVLYALIQKTIAYDDTNWSTKGLGSIWLPGSNSHSSEGGFAAMPGDIAEQTSYRDKNEEHAQRGFPSLISLPLKASSTHSRFAIQAQATETSTNVEINGRAAMLCFRM